MSDFYKIMENRRSILRLSKEALISQERLEEVVGNALKFTPTAFNGQEQRLVLLMDKKHDWFWNLVKSTLKAIVPAENFPSSEDRINGFLGGVGTILFYQDTAVTKGLQETFPIYKDNFPIWAMQSSGMLKYTLWTSLVKEGYGANIQHYTELIEAEVNEELNIDSNWKMVGQLSFGKAAQSPNPNKTFEPIENRLIVIK
ncbi:MAG: nitroreductase family protein [Defluviitaleaceae bacterium]|nr:nitroreductase family protein [Defluviitaleaceae bacterium]